jgi:transposase InsO family protein
MKWIDLSLVARITGLSKSTVSRRSYKECWVSRDKQAKGGIKRQFDIAGLPLDIQKIIIEKTINKKSRKKQIAVLADTTGNDMKRGIIKASILNDYKNSRFSRDEYCLLYNAGRLALSPEITRQYPSIDVVTLWRWERESPDGHFESLVTNYAKKSNGAGEKTLTISDKQIILNMYLTTKKWSAKLCFKKFLEVFPEKKNQVSYSTIKRLVNQLSPALRAWKRKGSKTLNDKFMPYIPRKYNFPVMEKWCSDHHQLDVYARDESGGVYRPWITVFQDMRSRKIVGFALSRYPSTQSILEAFLMAVMLYGAPKIVYFDNGKDYRSKRLHGFDLEFNEDEKVKINGVLASLSIKVIFCWPYHGQSKPVERWFRVVCEEFSKTLSGYIGSNTSISLEEHKANWKQIKDNINLTIEEVKREFEKYVAKYNAEHEHSGDGMNLRTPDEVFNEGIKDYIRIDIPEEYLNQICAKTAFVSVRRNGIQLEGIYYHAPELILYKSTGVKLMVKRDINDVGKLKVYDVDGKYICEAKNDVLFDSGITEDNIRRKRKAIKSEKKILNQQLKIVMTGKTVEELALEEVEEEKRKKLAQEKKDEQKAVSYFAV